VDIETARLRLTPFHPTDLLALIDGPESFEKSFGMPAADGMHEMYSSADISPAWLEQLRVSTEADPWLHGFAVVHRERGLVIGGIGFVGPPDGDGVVEIAYGVAPDFQGQGYATEAAQAGVGFAVGSGRVKTVAAHTLRTGAASMRVLAKCGFTRVGEIIDPVDGPVVRWEVHIYRPDEPQEFSHDGTDSKCR
jgi:ribosomal-protein-alanine N-acetyltransferase